MAAQLSPSELLEHLDARADFLLLDVRNEDDFRRWHVPAPPGVSLLNVPYFAFLEEEESSVARVPRGRMVVTVCAKGESSAFVAGLLRERGYDAANLTGGMESWGRHHEIRSLGREGNVEVFQVDRPGKGCLSYVVRTPGGDILIDPSRFPEPYLEFIRGAASRLLAVIDTHAHADHVSGGPALAHQAEAPYYLHPYDAIHPMDVLPAGFEFEPLRDGQQLELGAARFRVLHTPGHTLGQVCLLLNDTWLFTGDLLFLASVGRPDLGGRAEPWSHHLYDSLFRRLAELPGSVRVLPGHYSTRGEARGGLFVAQLAELRRSNPALQFSSEVDFVRFILASLPDFPPEYVEIKRLNLGLARAEEQKLSEFELGQNVCALAAAGARKKN